MKKIGVFVCWCGSNIAGSVDVDRVVTEVRKCKDVKHAENYMYMCSDPGQQLVKDTIEKEGLNGVVVACCSPRMHENTFRKAAGLVGLNSYLVEIANIREQCSWVHQNNKPVATAKAINIIEATLDKVRDNIPLETITISLNKRVLVVGAGIAGIMAALDLADAGYDVAMVEKQPAIGGHMRQLGKTFPYFQDVPAMLGRKVQEVMAHPNIKVYCNAEVADLDGYVGNFEVTIATQAAYVNQELCTNCGACLEVCPVQLPNAFDRGLTTRGAIYRYGGQELKPVVDQDACLHVADGSCDKCFQACSEAAISFAAEPESEVEKIGAIIMATGYDLYDQRQFPEYGGGRYPDVIDGLAMERMLDPLGPTGGKVVCPSDGRIPRSVVFVQCVGSRDPERHKPYCSRACCMYVAKQARQYRQQVAEGMAYISYMDIRSDSRDFEEFVQQGMEEDRLVYIRGRVAKIFPENQSLKVWTADTLTGRKVEIDADLVVLALAMEPRAGIKELAKKMRVTVDEEGFFSETHIKLYPVESSTKGVYLAGCCQSPKDITDTVSQALATSGKIQTLFSNETLIADPLIAEVKDDVCSGCGICVEICPYGARVMNDFSRISEVNQAVCQGCGACISACPNKACELVNSTSCQFIRMIGDFVQESPALELVEQGAE
ncbi:MAG: CoB--CoM heterodisulfide reductase iron-sulfur subunit A family protein [Deltaproteobacteria bacterium]|nr:CoB--CoM heterodisulfide reductase iron-sulfur subunit A family protein [Candidatus Anaeroferrophillus wilburensis]MBN2890040.1 CoB--CoM heterodisulfide reductase iron-sulfur subunit A family protein [Deltaproteobacteria bacterium]